MTRPDAASTAFSRMAGAIVATGGLVVFAAWIFGIEALKRPIGSAASMKANTALLFFISGCALWLLAARRARRVAVVLAAVAVAVSLATVSQDALGWNLSIDELILSAGAPINHEAPGRMSPLTAMSFLMIGLALCWPGRRGAWLPQGLAILSGGAAIITLIGYLYEAQQLRAIGPTTSVANHTAVLMLILAAGVVVLRPTEGLVGVLNEDSNIGRVFRRVVPVALLIPVLVGWLERQGQMRGWYSPGLGEALDAFATIALLTLVAWVSARMLARADARRRDAEVALARANEALEAKVEEQTAELQRSEREAAASAALFAHLFAHAPDAIVCVSPDRTITRFNAKAEELSGYRADDVIGQPAEILLAHRVAPVFREQWPSYLVMTGDTSIAAIGRRKDGVEFPTEVMFSTTDTPEGRLVVAIVRDITARRKMEEAMRMADDRLQASQRLEAIARLAGGAAHDFNNVMTVVTGYSELLLGRLQPGDPHRAAIEEIRRAGVRGAAVTRHLLAFSRRQVLSPAVVNLNAVVDDLCSMLPLLLGEEIRVDTQTAPDLWHVRVDVPQIEQAIINLAMNARDAMPEGGTLQITTGNVVVLESIGPAQGDVPPGAYAVLSVNDSGAGMDEVTRARAFEPFFTTKPVGQGTGLGLSSVYGVVRQSGGFIELDSAPGSGTTVRLYLPRVEEPVSAGSSRPDPGASPGWETILLVDDDAAVRALLQQVLAGAGYRVLEAASAHDALRICENHPGPVHLLIADVVMPGMSGGELAVRLAEAGRDIRVLLVSGDAQSLADDAGHAGAALLRKPFTPQELLGHVRQVLDQTPSEVGHG
jgi:hypothetical protein